MPATKMSSIPHRCGSERKNGYGYFLIDAKMPDVRKKADSSFIDDSSLGKEEKPNLLKKNENTDAPAHILDFADEILLHIFSHLSVASLTQIMLVNKRWKKLSCDKDLWEHVNLTSRHFTKQGMLGSILHRGVKNVVLNNVEVLESLCPQDHEICCDDFALEHLDATMTRFSKDTLFQILIKCSDLKGLSIPSCQIGMNEIAAIGNNSELKVLNLSMAVGLAPHFFNLLTKQCPGLAVLNIAWTNMTRDVIRFLCRLEDLKELNMSGLRGGINRRALEVLVTSCEKLTKLDLSDVTLQIGCMKLLTDHCSVLEDLSISRCSEVKPEQLFELVPLQSLVHLNLFGFVNSEALERFQNQRVDVIINKNVTSPICGLPENSYHGGIWEQCVGFII